MKFLFKMAFWSLFWVLAVGLSACLVPPSPSVNSESTNAPKLDQETRRILTAIEINPNDSLGYLQLARHFMSQNQPQQAKEVLEQALQVNPDSLHLIGAYSETLIILQQNSTALELLAQAIQKTPEEAGLYVMRGKLHTKLSNMPQAQEDFRTAVELDSQQYEALYFLGVLSALENQHRAAVEYFQQSLDINSNQPEAWRQLSFNWRELGNLHGAHQAMRAALEFDPNEYNYLQYYVSLLEKIREHEELEEVLTAMVRQFPYDSWTQAHYGAVLVDLKKFEQAEHHLKESLKLRPDYAWAMLHLGSLYAQTDRLEWAQTQFEEGLQQDGDNVWARIELARVYERRNLVPQAIRVYQQLADENKVNEAMYLKLAFLYRNELEIDRAIETLEDGHQRFPENTRLPQELVRYYVWNDQTAEALEILHELQEAFPDDKRILQQQISLYLQENQLEAAETSLLQLLELDAKDLWPRTRLARLYLDQQRFEQAEGQLRAWIGLNPGHQWGYAQLALLLLRENRFKEGQTILNQGLEATRQAPELVELVGLYLEKAEQWEQALPILLALHRAQPSNAEITGHLGLVSFRLGQKTPALEYLEQSLLLGRMEMWVWNLYQVAQPEAVASQWFGKQHALVRPTLDNIVSGKLQTAQELPQELNASNRLALASILELNQQHQETALKLMQATDTSQMAPWALFHLAYLHEINNLKNQAVALYQQCLQSWNTPWIHHRLGQVNEDLQQYAQANHHWQEFLKTHPDTYWVHFNIALNLTQLGLYQHAMQRYQQVLRLNPRHATSMNNLAWSMLVVDDQTLYNPEAALGYAQQAVQLDPSVEHLDTLAEAYFKNGQVEQAIETIKKAILSNPRASNRNDYLFNQYNRFRNGNLDSKPEEVLIN